MTHTRAADTAPAGSAVDCTDLGTDLRLALRSFGVTLTLVPSDRGVVLEGLARTFYGKQMAQEFARRARLVVTGNRIVVVKTRDA